MSYTVADMVQETYENLGESTDLYPYGSTYGTVDLTTAGAQKLLKWLNRAYRKVGNTQLPDGTFVRFRSFERRKFFTATVVTGTVSSAPAANQVAITGLIATANKYANWILDIGAPDANSQGGEQHVIVGNDASASPVLTLADSVYSAPTVGETVNVYKKWWACSLLSGAGYHTNEFIAVDPKEDFGSALWIYDVQQQKDIRRYDERTPLYKQVLTQLYPAMFWDLETPAGMWPAAGIGGGVEFDVAPVNSSTYELHYYGLSEALTTAGQLILIPDQFSEMLVKWATKTGMIRDREWDASYAIRKEFETDMQTAIQDGAMRFEYDQSGLWIESD
jgi:hypothetical protein